MRFKMDFKNLPRCGASARSNSGLPCRQAAMPNGRCFYHGGNTPIKNGLYTKMAKAQCKEHRIFIDESRATLNSLKLQI